MERAKYTLENHASFFGRRWDWIQLHNTLLANIGQASACHTEGINTKRYIAVLAELFMMGQSQINVGKNPSNFCDEG